MLLSLQPLGSHAASTSPTYSLAMQNGKVSLLLTLDFHQNLTALASSFSLPSFTGSLQGSNSTDALQVIQNALGLPASPAKVSSLFMKVASTSVDNATRSQWFNVTLRFDLTGLANNLSMGGERTDLSWKSFAVMQDLAVGGTEANNIGPKYIAAYAQQIALSQVSSRFLTVSLRFDGRLVGPSGFTSAASSFRTMNFSRLVSPISSWQEAYNSSSNQVTWSYDAGPNLGLSVNEISQEPADQGGGTSSFRYGLFYNLKAQVSGPNRSSVNGNIFTVVSDSSATLMSIIIAAIAIPGIGAFVYERRLFGKSAGKKSRR